MKRRSFLGLLGGAVVALQAKPDAALTYGYLDPTNCLAVTGHPPVLARVAFNGTPIDLTEWRVMACDDRVGYVEVLKRDARGGFYVDPKTGHFAREKRAGHVVVTFAKDTD